MTDNILDRFFEFHKRKHEKLIESKITNLRVKQVWNALANDEIYTQEKAVKVIKSNTGLDNDQEILDSLNTLIYKKGVVTSFGIRGDNLFIRRNPHVKL